MASARRKLLLLLKPLDDYAAVGSSNGRSSVAHPRVLEHLNSRSKVHQEAIQYCQKILQRKPVEWEAISGNDLSRPIRDVDMVLTIGGDGTLLRACHFVDDSVPILGVNSDPSKVEEIEEFSNEFDASRSTGYLCAATLNNFENVIDSILEGQSMPSDLSRISICVNSKLLSTYALNDILLADPCPAAVSRFSLRVHGHDKDGLSFSPLVNCQSSGIRVSTATGSTAAMLSAGGLKMPILSCDLQYMVREPILPGKASSLMRGTISPDQSLEVGWYGKEGIIYVDGCHVQFPVKLGDKVEITAKGPVLKVYLPSHLLVGQSPFGQNLSSAL